MKIQPIDNDSNPIDSTKPVVVKSRLKRLFDLQLPNVLRISSTEKPPNGGGGGGGGGGVTEFEPSSVCLDKMVQNFMEESHDRQSIKCNRNRCNCFNGNSNDSSDDEFDAFGEPIHTTDASDILKALVICTSITERNLLADTAKIIENNKNIKRKDELRNIVTASLRLDYNYNSSICKSKWDKVSTYPAGEYEYIDVVIDGGGERIMIDVDFRSEFEIARSTGTYKMILQSLPFIFVGKSERLCQIVTIVSEAAKQSLKKKGMYFPPWRKAEYMRAKWLSPFTRNDAVVESVTGGEEEEEVCLDLIFGEDSKTTPSEVEKIEVMTWQPPAVKPKSVEKGTKIVTGLASLLKERP